MFCRKCGGQMKDSAKWCPYCGQKVEITESTTTQPNEAAITKESVIQSQVQVQPQPQVQPQFQVHPQVYAQQPVRGQQPYIQQMPMNQSVQNNSMKPSLTKRGLWGIIGAFLFLISLFSEVLILMSKRYRSYEVVFRYDLQKHYLVLICVAFAALLLVLFSCSKTVLLAALYFFYYYVALIFQYLTSMGTFEREKLIVFLITASLALIGLTFLIVNVFLDKRKQRI